MESMVKRRPRGVTLQSPGFQEACVQLLSGDARRAVFAPLDDGALRSEAVVRRVGSAIALGLLGDGEQLPTETDLATMLNVSTVTLREALAELRKLGLVDTRRGRGGGSFVQIGRAH